MELLSDPFHKFKTHVPKLLPVIIGGGIGFLGVAKILAFFLETYPDPSVCLFIGLITGMLPSLFREAGEQGRPAGSWVSLGAAFAVILALLISLGLSRSRSRQLRLVPVLRVLPGAVGHCPGHELLHAAHAAGPVHAVCGRPGQP